MMNSLQFIKVCIVCHKEFKSPVGNYKTCSVECSQENKKWLKSTEYKNQHTNFENKKHNDNKYYKAKSDSIKTKRKEYYFSTAKEKRNNTLVKITCDICSKEFMTREINIKRSKSHLCSKECLKIFFHNINKGENSPLWKGGITTIYDKTRQLPIIKDWVKTVMDRDNYTCKKCNTHGDVLAVHHIVNFSNLYLKNDPLLTDTNNGITFCKICHDEFHSKYGRTNNNIVQVKEFING